MHINRNKKVSSITNFISSTEKLVRTNGLARFILASNFVAKNMMNNCSYSCPALLESFYPIQIYWSNFKYLFFLESSNFLPVFETKFVKILNISIFLVLFSMEYQGSKLNFLFFMFTKDWVKMNDTTLWIVLQPYLQTVFIQICFNLMQKI